MNMPEDHERIIFRRLDPLEQSMALFDMLRSIRGDAASTRRLVIELQEDIRGYRITREEKEQTTTQKIKSVLNERFDFGKWFMDKVMPAVAAMMIIALLYLIFKP